MFLSEINGATIADIIPKISMTTNFRTNIRLSTSMSSNSSIDICTFADFRVCLDAEIVESWLKDTEN